jgi:AcrR family transcriptional regulator
MGDSAVDGRYARSVRTRTAILEAFVDLIASGERPPSGVVAERAGVTQRTLFNHFPDVGALVAAAAEHQSAAVAAHLPEAKGDPKAWLRAMVTILERIAPVRWAALAQADRPEIRAAVERVDAALRGRLLEVFADGLASRPAAARRAALDALVLEVDPATWYLRRRVQHLSRPAATAAMTAAVLAIADRERP